MQKRYVLDASAVLCGKELPEIENIYIPLSVLHELGKGKYRRKVENLVGIKITVVTPASQSVELVKKHANETGDLLRLSNCDIDVIAVAYELSAIILTDDYSIQNLARHMGLEYQPVAEGGIQEEFKWEYVCAGCRRKFDTALAECPVCGSEIRTKRQREKHKRS
jgi:UPF0271 protein